MLRSCIRYSLYLLGGDYESIIPNFHQGGKSFTSCHFRNLLTCFSFVYSVNFGSVTCLNILNLLTSYMLNQISFRLMLQG